MMVMEREEDGKHYNILSFYPSQSAHTHTHTHSHIQILFPFFSYINGKSYYIYCSVSCSVCSTIYHGHFFFLNLFIYLFLAALGLCCCVRAFSSCSERGYSSLRCVGFSLRWLLLLLSMGPRRAGFSSCGAQA